MRYLLSILGLVFLLHNYAQTTIGIQNFDGGTPTMTTTGGTNFSGSSVAGDRPATSPFYTSANNAIGVTNGTAAILSGNITGLAAYTSKFFDFRLAAWSIGSTTNGTDAGDLVTVAISLDGGATFSNEVQITGNSNAYWSYSATGNATVTYDGNNVPTAFSPTGGGNRIADGYSTVRVDLPNTCTQAIIRITLLNNSTNERWTVDDIRLMGTLASPCVAATAPTISASSDSNTPSCTSDAISWTNGNGTNRIVVVSTSPIAGSPVNQTNYTAGSYGVGSTLNTGEFVVYNGTGNSTTISGLTPGTTYFYTIFEYNVTTTSCTESYLTSSTLSGSFTTITGCGPSTPQILGLLANSCSTDEGLNEFFVFQNGTSPQSLSTMTVNFPSFTYCNSSCGTQTLLNNTSAITALNTAAGCALFTFADPIPANATVVVFTGNPPTAPPNFSAQCGQTYYVVFCNNPTDVSGRFANSGTGTRTLSVNFGATTDAVTYDLATISNTDGAYVAFDYPGNPFYSVISNCAGPLGLDLLQWKGSYSESGNILEWKTTNESHVSHFEILKLNDQNKFVIIDQLPANNTKLGGSYFSIDRENQNTSFYQLKSVDQNGTYSLSPILKVDALFENMLIGFNNGHFVSNDWEQIEAVRLFTMNGQAVLSATKNELLNVNHPSIPTGMYILQVTKRNGEQFTQKLPVNAF